MASLQKTLEKAASWGVGAETNGGPDLLSDPRSPRLAYFIINLYFLPLIRDNQPTVQ